MNDLHTPLDEFKSMYAEMVRKFRAVNPNGEVLAVATMWPNTDSAWVLNQIRTIDVLNELEKEFGSFGVADMTTMHAYVLQRKRYRDATANNINHPNDFIGRIYAQVILKTLLGEKFEDFYGTKNC